MGETIVRPAASAVAPPETVPVRAMLVGERIDTRTLERGQPLALAPLTLRFDGDGIAVLFRYGVIVCFNATPAAIEAFVDGLAPVIVAPLPTREVEEARLRVDPAVPEEHIGPLGVIVLKDMGTVRLQIVADILAKSVVLAHQEMRIAATFDRIEPLAATLREKGRAGAQDPG